MEGENRGCWKAREYDHRTASRRREADGLARFQCYAVGDNTGILQFGDDAI